ncbi:MAG TPA: hypothetical protein DGT21_17205, partial [Armatimonadetes bacterium]|nr:hypothetical protein [Armatimonadota bacterium]
GDRDRDRNQGDWNRGDRDRNQGDWNRGDRDRNQGDWNRGDRDRDRDQDDRNRGDRDRDHNRGDRDRGDGGWNRLPDWDRNRDWDRDRRGDHRGPDRDYRPHDRYDRVRDRDGWWQHHRYADKTYKRDSRRPSPFWRIDWGYPYYGRYYNTWYYVPRINVVWRSDARPPLLGSAIVAYDDTFLGIISRDWQDDDSISNPYGRFGCPESPWSIWNMDGYWGSEYNFDSPWNPYATRPPRVYSGNYLLGYLTNNPDLYPRIDPYWLMDYLDVWVMD